jgi:mono/diheme cytochrome c family protein
LACNDPVRQKEAPSNESIPTVVNGEGLFKINCSQCHRPAEDFAAPALAGVEKRWSNKILLYAFVRNAQEVINKDKYAADLFKKWNNTYMQPFPRLSNEEIDAILQYCNTKAL